LILGVINLIAPNPLRNQKREAQCRSIRTGRSCLLKEECVGWRPISRFSGQSIVFWAAAAVPQV